MSQSSASGTGAWVSSDPKPVRAMNQSDRREEDLTWKEVLYYYHHDELVKELDNEFDPENPPSDAAVFERYLVDRVGFYMWRIYASPRPGQDPSISVDIYRLWRRRIEEDGHADEVRDPCAPADLVFYPDSYPHSAGDRLLMVERNTSVFIPLIPLPPLLPLPHHVGLLVQSELQVPPAMEGADWPDENRRARVSRVPQALLRRFPALETYWLSITNFYDITDITSWTAHPRQEVFLLPRGESFSKPRWPAFRYYVGTGRVDVATLELEDVEAVRQKCYRTASTGHPDCAGCTLDPDFLARVTLVRGNGPPADDGSSWLPLVSWEGEDEVELFEGDGLSHDAMKRLVWALIVQNMALPGH